MTYGYIRVSTDKQTVENQRFEILKFCEKREITIDGWIEETISGTKNYRKRELGKLLGRIQENDIIICAELSRLGRNLFMVMEILNLCMEKKCHLWTIKEKFNLSMDIQSKVLAFAFGISAEIERQLLSQRTKEALARKKAEGITLGRKAGVRGKLNVMCIKNAALIQKLLTDKVSKSKIASLLGISKSTLYRYLVYTGKYIPKKKNSKKWERGIYQ